jgi:murein DD-endopeptidase MepM/ murein hydrolase activator NlpD
MPAVRPLKSGNWLLIVACVLVAGFQAAHAQSAYRYRDANGQWVFTDQAAAGAPSTADALNLAREPEALHVRVERQDTPALAQLYASNNCLCVVTVRMEVTDSDFSEIPKGTIIKATLKAGERRLIASARRTTDAKEMLHASWTYALGPPGAVHNPTHPYRAPFALGSTFTVTQAYPTRITHVTPDSQYAVDFGLPDGTPVYAAREGTVINVRHDAFQGGTDVALLDQANVVEILHEDGTIALYAHLQWDSIRVRVGQRVKVGEYIANSGNTGFTTGPHLHFAVWRNVGAADVSVPVQFAGVGQEPVSAATSVPITAY